MKNGAGSSTSDGAAVASANDSHSFSSFPLTNSRKSSNATNGCWNNNFSSETAIGREFKKLGVYLSKPKFKDMSTVQLRILSFKSWPNTKKQTSADLAEAGFFFIGENDSVQCFYCGGVLKNWLPNDDPWVEHARWFDSCDFVRLCKGDSFMWSSKQKTPSNDVTSIDVDDNENNVGALSIEDLDAKIPSWRGHEDVRTAFDMGYDEKIIASALITNDFSTFETLDEMIDRIESLRPYLENMKVTGSASTTKLPKLPSITNPKLDARDVKLCKICMDAEISVVFLPCAHLVCCPNCSPAFESCPLCRTEAVARLRIYMT